MTKVRYIDGPAKGDEIDFDRVRLGDVVRQPVIDETHWRGWSFADYVIQGSIGDRLLAKLCLK